MTDEPASLTDHHLREALRHLKEAQDGDLRKTNAIALEQVSNTVSMVLREHSEDGE
ncbi:hypothetical protein [Natronorubrum sulfidifaciens]|uniref:Uncharacterized protein n=1 Tax=Natronorubrum sulfidifaciens JCM 14089 TaxID=1230460 RepID=L9W878_9EURY|nr:hypothetical protein [Natronorubrum sulfidifaciens]ELY44508.1 hypothetical protein C495_11414 [Natronorubrum sulfidifaciens JCM 14089]